MHSAAQLWIAGARESHGKEIFGSGSVFACLLARNLGTF